MIPSREPAVYAEAVRLILVALVALGWITIDDNATNAVVTAVGAILSIALSIAVRSHVTPIQPSSPVSPVD